MARPVRLTQILRDARLLKGHSKPLFSLLQEILPDKLTCKLLDTYSFLKLFMPARGKNIYIQICKAAYMEMFDVVIMNST